MSNADTQVHEQSGAAKARQRVAWSIVLVVIAALLVVRAVIGTNVGRAPTPADPAGLEEKMHAFGLVYVKPEVEGFVPLDKEELAEAQAKADAVKSTAPIPKWRPVKAGEKAQIQWTEWQDTTPASYVLAKDEAAKDPTKTVDIELSWPRTIGVWLAAFFTLAVLSFLVGDNPAYKFTESVVVGVSAAFWMVEGAWATLVPKLWFVLQTDFVQTYFLPLTTDKIDAPGGFQWLENFGLSSNWIAFAVALIPATMGLLLLCRLNRKTAWVGIFPLAFIVGTFAGLKFVSFTESDLMEQILAMATPLIVMVPDVNAQGVATGATNVPYSVGATISAILMFVGVLSVLIYFFFSLEHRGIVGKTARVGIWVLMITFGASFGFTVMGRIALLSQRFEFLFDQWLWLTDPSMKH